MANEESSGRRMKNRPCGLNLAAFSIHLPGVSSIHHNCEDNHELSRKSKPPFPPFEGETAARKVRMAEDAWNTHDPERVSRAYTPDGVRRNRAEFLSGRKAIVAFLTRKWHRELDYRLIKELWAFDGNRIALRFAYEWHDDSGQ